MLKHISCGSELCLKKGANIMISPDVYLKNEIHEALNRYLSNQNFEERIFEHPEKALSRTSLIELSNNHYQVNRMQFT